MTSFKKLWAKLLASTVVAMMAFSLQARPAEAGATLLFDIDTGRVLYAENADQPWYPASLTKIMTAYLVFEAMRDGRLSKDSEIVTSARANAMPASKIGLPVGAKMSLELAIKSLIIKSANDVSVMLAEAIDGSVEKFAERMNRTAKRLGMTSTSFVNPNGLPDAGQITTARDLARLTRAVIKDFPEHAGYWATPSFRIGRVRLSSHNSLLRSFGGTTGVKTGFICDSGFNIVASAKRDGRHLAAIVLGSETPQDRGSLASAMLAHGFETYAWKVFLKAPDLSSLETDRDTAQPRSIRGQIKVWDCRRRRPAAKTKKREKKEASRPQVPSQSPARRTGAIAASRG